MANDPFATHPAVPELTVTSDSITEGAPYATEEYSGIFGVPGGQDRSPHLRWEGAPEGTKSFALTVVDPDAPTGSGFWHWTVTNIPASVTEIPEGAGGDDGAGLPEGAVTHPHDAGGKRFLGAAPPAGHGAHRYFHTVYAVDVEDLGVPADATPALVGFNLFGHTLARGTIVTTAEIS